MKIFKIIFYGICTLLLALCAFILVCALNPELTDKLSAALYHQSENSGKVEDKGLQAGTGNAEEGLENGNGGAAAEAGSAQEGGDRNGNPGEESVPEGIIDPAAARSGYTPPQETAVRAPDEVAGRTGYVPVQESGEQISGDGGEWKSEAGVGETGEGLDFDGEKYPYYAMLNEGMKKLYRQIYANAQALNTTFAPTEAVSFDRLKKVFEAVYNDHPELFWLETGYSCKYLKTGQCMEITLKYNSTADDLESARAAFNSRAEGILAGAASLGSDAEKEKYVHDRLISQTEYNLGADKSQSAYSALVDGESVCAGYSRALQYLLQQLDIPCYYCTGYSGESHAWNIVKLDGTYYNVDATWNDTEPATYDYYNKSDADFAGTHARRGLSVYLPACSGPSAEGSGADNSQVAAEADKEAGRPGSGQPSQAEPSQDAAEASADRLDKPLTYEPDYGELNEEADSEGSSADGERALAALGLSKEDVLNTLSAYYEDCYGQLTEAGAGSVEFQNVIPESLWESLEGAYTGGSYRTGYVDKALKELDLESFSIRLWAERLGGGYYLLYHNVVTE